MKRIITLLLFISITLTAIAMAFINNLYTTRFIRQKIDQNIVSLQEALDLRFFAFNTIIESEQSQIANAIEGLLPKLTEKLIQLEQPLEEIPVETLQQLVKKFSIDHIYLIDHTGEIVNTTFVPDLHFNLTSISPELTTFLQGVYGKGQVLTDRMTLSTKTGSLNTYAYYSPKNKNYIVEVSVDMRNYIRLHKGESYLDSLFDRLFLDAINSNTTIIDLDMFMYNDLAAWSVTQEGQSMEVSVLHQLNEESQIRQYEGNRLTVYNRFTPTLQIPTNYFHQDLASKVTYDISEIRTTAIRTIILSVLTILLIVPFVYWFANLVLQRKLIKPLNILLEALERIKQGSYDTIIEEIDVPELQRIGDTSNQMQQEILKREQKLISYQKNLEQRVIEGIKEAQAATEAKSTFLSTMSHEIRTPMNVIMGFGQLLEKDPSLSEKQLKQITTINRSSYHLLELINDILELSKIEAGKLDINLESFNLLSLIDDLESFFLVKAHGKKISFSIQVNKEVPQFIRTDKRKLYQILLNLVGNAIKFTDIGDVSLKVSFKQPFNNIEIGNKLVNLCFEVKDTGVGIAEEELDKLFEPFTQTTSGKNIQEGTGLGLTIVSHYIELLDGTVEVQSIEKQGTTFTINLPVSISTEFCEANTYSRSSPQVTIIGLAANQPSYKILIIEDKDENSRLLCDILEPIGFTVQIAENGQKGIIQAQSWQPNLILMDMQMPVMDGYEATKHIKAHAKGKTPIIIAITAQVFEKDRQNILATGCDDFIPKPFIKNDLC